ncbi:hypothetical protein AKJ16_DCAP05009 [Drosera capensis]
MKSSNKGMVSFTSVTSEEFRLLQGWTGEKFFASELERSEHPIFELVFDAYMNNVESYLEDTGIGTPLQADKRELLRWPTILITLLSNDPQVLLLSPGRRIVPVYKKHIISRIMLKEYTRWQSSARQFEALFGNTNTYTESLL